MRVEPIEGCRVRGIVDNAIMVRLEDVVPGDVLSIRNDESDPIIQEVLRKDGCFKFIYRHHPGHEINQSMWMNPEASNCSGHCFIHDLKNERSLFEPEE